MLVCAATFRSLLGGAILHPLAAADPDLLEAWRDGNAEAGSELLRRYFQPLYEFFSSKLDHGVEDLIQRTLLACIESRDRVRDAPNFRAFVYGVARHELYGHFRLNRRDSTEELPSVAALVASPSELIDHRVELRLLSKAMRQLPLDHQITLELFYWEDMSGSEIAAVLGAPEGTIRTRLRRARQLLSERISALASSPAEVTSTLGNLSTWARKLRHRLGVDGVSDP